MIHADDEPATWLADHGDALYAYAMARVRRPDMAEDLVQDTLLAAMEGQFDGRSSRRTWLVTILRRRLADRLRRTDDGRAEQALDDAIRTLFNERGKWARAPRRWPLERRAADADALRRALTACLDRLPPRTAEAFLLVEHEETPIPAVAELLGTTPANVHVMLHRARLALRTCLEQRDAAPRPRD